MTISAGGRSSGRGDNAADSSGSSRASTPSRSLLPARTRVRTMFIEPRPNGGRPVAAKANVAAQPHQSVAAVTAAPSMTSGDRYPGVPMTSPVAVNRGSSATWAMPKSMTTGSPSSSSRTLPGLRSRCTTPTAWIASRAPCNPRARSSKSPADSGPRVSTRSSRASPAIYRVTTKGRSPDRSQSMIGATLGCRIRARVATSRSSRARASGSCATCGRNTLTATARPCGSRARWTTPIPPSPIRWIRR